MSSEVDASGEKWSKSCGSEVGNADSRAEICARLVGEVRVGESVWVKGC